MFEVRDIQKETKYLDELIQMGYNATPITLIDGEPIVGFDVPALEALLKE